MKDLLTCWSGVEESFGGVGGYAKLLLLFVDAPAAEDVLLLPPDDPL